jgi:predicted TIM-barrel fold metal-dependent hydrolase
MIVDAHIHMPSFGWSGREFKCQFQTLEAILQHLDECGISHALGNTRQGVFAENVKDLHDGNQAALDYAASSKGVLYPGAVIHPAFPVASIAWLERFRDKGFYWVGELVQYQCGIEFDQPEWLKLFEYCAEHGHIIQLHSSETILKVADYFPEMPVVYSHLNLELLEQISLRPNLWVDISGRCCTHTAGSLEAAVEIVGSNKLLFGTDFSGYEIEPYIDRINAVIADPAEKEKIFSQNIIKLLADVGSKAIA